MPNVPPRYRASIEGGREQRAWWIGPLVALLAIGGTVTADSLISGEFPGGGWIIAKFHGDGGHVRFQFIGIRPTGMGILAATELDQDGAGLYDFAITEKVGLWNAAHVGVDAGSGLAASQNIDESDTSNEAFVSGFEDWSYQGTGYGVGLVSDTFERWRFEIETDPTVIVEQVWIGEKPPLFVRLEDMQGFARAEGQATLVGAHAAIEAHYEFNVNGTLLGTYRKALALQQVDGLDIMTATHPDGTVEGCGCNWNDLQGPARAGPGQYRLDLTGASLRALTGETVFLLAADVNVPEWN